MVLVRFGLVLALAVGFAAAPAAAQQPVVSDEDAPVVDAVAALEAEILVLVELDAFESTPPALEIVHRTWAEYADGFTRDGLLQWLYEADASGSRALDALVASGAEPTAAIRAALGAIGSTDRVVLEAGGTLGIAPAAYVDALSSLTAMLGANGGSLAGGDSPASLAPVRATRAPATTLALEERDGDTASFASASEYPWLPVTIALLGVMVVGALIVVSGRRRRDAAAGRPVLDRLLDAGRRLTAARDATEIAEVAVSEALSLGRARLGAFIQVAAGRLTLMHQTAAFVEARRLDGGVLSRVAATGRSVRLIARDEPALQALPAALLAVPVTSIGSVTGILLLVRSEDAAFTHREDDLIGRLAPMVGAALVVAETHDGVAALTRSGNATEAAGRSAVGQDLAAAVGDIA